MTEASRGESDRAHRRLSLIKSFLKYAKKDKKTFFQENNEDKIHLKRTISYQRFLTMFGMFSSLAIYHCFFTKIYDFRSHELLNMRSVPFALKFGTTCLVTYLMCSKMRDDYIYDPELYRLAIKYRDRYDSGFKERIAVINYDK